MWKHAVLVWVGLAICAGCRPTGSASDATTPSAGVDAPPSESVTGNVTTATDLVNALAKGDMAAATAKFDATMKAALPSEKLSEVWQDLVRDNGSFRATVNARTEQFQGTELVFVTTEFERGKVDVQVTMDRSGNVSGLFIRPAGFSLTHAQNP